MNEKEQRERVAMIAKSWLGTKYHHMGKIKGAGVDCLTLISEVFYEAGLVPKIEVPFYPRDWMQHRGAEKYLEGILRYSKEIFTEPQKGDLILWKMGRCFSHGAIVIDYPTIIHAQYNSGVVLENAEASFLQFIGENTSEQGKERERKVFSYWG